MHWGRGDFQVYKEDARLVREQLAGSPLEYQLGAPSLEPAKENSTEGGADPLVLAMFYWAVVQAVLIFGDETWFLLEAMSKNLEGVHVGFLKQMTGKTTKQ